MCTLKGFVCVHFPLYLVKNVSGIFVIIVCIDYHIWHYLLTKLGAMVVNEDLLAVPLHNNLRETV